MGVNIEQWRMKIGSFVRYSLIITHHHNDVTEIEFDDKFAKMSAGTTST